MRSLGLGVALAVSGLLIVSCGSAANPGELGPVTTCAGTRATFPGVGELPGLSDAGSVSSDSGVSRDAAADTSVDLSVDSAS